MAQVDVQKIWRNIDMWFFLRHASRQTDKQTEYKHADSNTSPTYQMLNKYETV